MGYRITYGAPRRRWGLVVLGVALLVIFREVLDPALWQGLHWQGGIYDCLAELCGRLIRG